MDKARKAEKSKPKLNKMGQPESFGVEKDTPHMVNIKPKVIVGANKPKTVKRPSTWDPGTVLKTKW